MVNRIAAEVHERYPGVKFMTSMRSHRVRGRAARRRQRGHVRAPARQLSICTRTNVPKARELGNEVWYYTCVVPDHPYPNFFYRLAADRLADDPGDPAGEVPRRRLPVLRRGPAGKHNHGPRHRRPRSSRTGTPRASTAPTATGCSSIPGPTGRCRRSALEAMRDGMDDLAYYQLVRQRAGRGRRGGAGARVNNEERDRLHPRPRGAGGGNGGGWRKLIVGEAAE